MANQDSFIDEVTEEVRRDRLYALMRRYGWIAIAAVILIVGGASLNEWRKASAQAAAEAQGDAIIAALQSDDAEERAAALRALETPESPGAQAMLGLMLAAAETEIDNDAASAEALDAVINDTAIPQVYRDVALLKQVLNGAGEMAPEDRIAALAPIMQPGNPFRLLAIEQRAFAEVEMGDVAAALTSLEGIVADAEVSADLRRRAQQLIVALGGSIEPS